MERPVEVIMNFDEKGRTVPMRLRYYSLEDARYEVRNVSRIYYRKVDRRKETYSLLCEDSRMMIWRDRDENIWHMETGDGNE